MMLAGPRYGGGPLGFGVAVGLRKGDPSSSRNSTLPSRPRSPTER
jgi:hypothetical protein